MTTPDMLAHASHYARRGWPVFPLIAGKKQPATTNGFKDATTDLAKIRQWWGMDPNYNIGIAVPAGYLVVDIDPRNGGNETARRVSEELGAVPPTLVARTRAGGYHYWFRSPLDPSCTSGSLGVGVDIKIAGKGYVVAPPSVVPCDGQPGVYSWLQVRPVARLPKRWIERLTKVARPKRKPPEHPMNPLLAEATIQWECQVLSHAERGNRNNALFQAAARLAERGCLTPEAERRLGEVATEIGLDSWEIDRVIGNGRQAVAS